MDPLRTFNTSAFVAADCASIKYVLCRVSKGKQTGPLMGQGGDFAPDHGDLHKVEARLRAEQYVVIADDEEQAVWLFESPAKTLGLEDSEVNRGLPSIGTYRLLPIFRGELLAANLATLHSVNLPNTRSTGSGAATHAAQPSRRANGGGASREPAGNGQIPQTEKPTSTHQDVAVSRLYQLFISAVVAAISYRLVFEFGLIPLGYRNFLQFDQVRTEPEGNVRQLRHEISNILTLNVYLTTSGSLIISSLVEAHPGLYQLQQFISYNECLLSPGMLLMVAPNGMVVKFVELEIMIGNGSEDADQRLVREPFNPGKGDKSWKRAVIEWIRARGIEVVDEGKHWRWVRIRLPQSAVHRLQENGLTCARVCLWPAVFCFAYASQSSVCRLSSKVAKCGQHTETDSARPLSDGPNATRWCQTRLQPGFKDPWQSALDWVLDKPERDFEQDLELQAEQIGERDPSLQITDEQMGTFATEASSPTYARTGPFNDFQNVGGVYPTPPDGVVTNATGGIPAIDASISTPGNTESQIRDISNRYEEQVLDQMDIEPADTVQYAIQTQHRASASPANGPIVLLDEGDGMFGDIHDNDFGPDRITDADFNFFDEPDSAGLELLVDNNEEQTGRFSTSSQSEHHDNTFDMYPGPEKSFPVNLKTVYAETAEVGSAVHNFDSPTATHTEPDSSKHTLCQTMAGQSQSPQREKATEDEVNAESRNATTSPGLSSMLIRENLFPVTGPGFSNEVRNGNVFQPLCFNPNLILSDAKYGPHGRFAFHFSDAPHFEREVLGKYPTRNLASSSPSLALTSLPSDPRQNKLDKSFRDVAVLQSTDDFDSDVSSCSRTSISSSGNSIAADLLDDGTGSSPRLIESPGSTSDNRISQHVLLHGGQVPETLSGLGRVKANAEYLLVSQLMEPDLSSLLSVSLPLPSPLGTDLCLSCLQSGTGHQSRGDYSFRRQPLGGAFSEEDLISIAQVIADQSISSTLGPLGTEFRGSPSDIARSYSNHSTSAAASELIRSAVADIFKAAVQCDVARFAAVHDVVSEPPQLSNPQPRPALRKTKGPTGPSELREAIAHDPFRIQTPMVRVQRSEAPWEVLPTALKFWESLGLGPISNAKDLTTFCIFPWSQDLLGRIDSFLDSMAATYESCKLGSHCRGNLDGYPNGLVPVKVEDPSSASAFKSGVLGISDQLGAALAKQTSRDKGTVVAGTTIVIYFVDPFNHAGAEQFGCVAFWALFKKYRQTLQASRSVGPGRDLVLQSIPIGFLASFDAPMVPDHEQLMKLSREVYDRTPPNVIPDEASTLKISSAASFYLKQPVPRQVPFRICAEATENLLQENSHLHVAYSYSSDRRWITTAWTDNTGKHQTHASYCLSGGRAFVEVAQEIWVTCLEIMRIRRLAWRISLARVGVMEREEMKVWTSLITAPSQVPIATALVSVDLKPPLALTSTTAPNLTVSSAGLGHPVPTPANTPQQTSSPDSHGLAASATPTEQSQDQSADMDANLLDAADEGWGVILSHRLHNSDSLTEYRPSLASGLLISRTGDDCAMETGQVHGTVDLMCIAVNLLWLGGNGSGSPAVKGGARPNSVTGGGHGALAIGTRGYESVLRDLLLTYRCLGVLAKLKGMNDTKGGVVPWHVVAASRGVQALETCFFL